MSTLLDVRNKVIGIVSDDSGKLAIPTTTSWAASTAYALGARVTPQTANGHIYKCTTAGTSGAAQPTWPTTPGAAVTDNTVVWTEEPDDYNRNINAAISRYSKHRPNTKVADITGNGTNDYATPTGWIDEFSQIKSIEHPINDVPATLLENDEYEIYQTPTAKKIRLKFAKPTVSESFRTAFTILRLETTIPDSDVDALASLAAALCLEELANIFAQASDSLIAADSVDYRSKSSEFSARAKRLMQLYKEHMGIRENDIAPPASAIADLDVGYPGGRDRLTHPRWSRERR